MVVIWMLIYGCLRFCSVAVEVDPSEYSTYQNFNNGMANSLLQAMVNGAQQTGSDLFALHYNPNHGFLDDSMEIAFDNFWGQFGVFNSGASERTGEIFLDVSRNQLVNNQQGVNFANHSQGNILLRTGIASQQSSRFDFINELIINNRLDPEKYQPTVNGYGSPVNKANMKKIFDSLGLRMNYKTVSNEGDPVAELFGLNKGVNETYRLLDVSHAPRILDFWYLSGKKYDDDPRSLFGYGHDGVSHHSTYECKENCGRWPGE